MTLIVKVLDIQDSASELCVLIFAFIILLIKLIVHN